MEATPPEKPLKTQYSGLVKSLGRYWKNAKIRNEQAYLVGKRDALTDLAQFIMHETNDQPLNISMNKVLEYINNKRDESDNKGNNKSGQSNAVSDTKMQTENVEQTVVKAMETKMKLM